MSRILVVDDHDNSRFTLCTILKREGYEVTDAKNGTEAIKLLDKEYFDLIMTDLKMEEVDGFDIIDYVKSVNPSTEVIVITAYATIETAVKAIKLGAYDYISKPMRREEIILTIQKALEKTRLIEEINILKKQVKEEKLHNDIIGNSTPMVQVLKMVKEVSNLDVPVLILGESGTGKELIARAIHYQSSRSHKSFIAINCGALPENLLESELFGHVKGAFTGAFENKRGLFKEADGGTLFLDEIGEMSLSAQAKLLRTLETNEIRQVGGNRIINVNTRIVCATNCDLKKRVDEKKFRSDLLFRINIFPITLPALRDRIGDIRILANYFLAKYAKKYLKPITNIENGVYNHFEMYQWPGNVRELENIIERAVILAKDNTITQRNISTDIIENHDYDINLIKENDANNLQYLEKSAILRKLIENNWNKSLTAKALGISKTTLWRKINKYNLTRS